MDVASAPREELLQVIGDLQATVARLEAALTLATTRIAALEAELARRSGPPKTPENSSVPPAKGFRRVKRPPPAESAPKPGPPHGHPGRSRHRVAPDIVLSCEPTRCERCGEPLAGAPQRRVGVSQVVDLPPVRPVVVEAWRYAAQCLACGTTTRAPYPPGLEPTRVFGPQIEALVTYLHEQHHVGYQRLRAIGQDLFGLHLSEGAVANALARTAARLAPVVATIREQVRASPVIGSDETSARVHGQTWWQWVFQTPAASYHQIVPRRNGAVVAAFQDERAAGTWVSDLWRPQLHAQAARHQICLAHQLRELQYVLDAEQSIWAAAFQGLLRAAIHLAHERDAGRWPPGPYAAAVAMVEAWCAALLRTPVPGAEASRLWVRFREHREHLFVFLYDAAVPPTNNASEQALRNSVVHRKVTGGFRSEWGAAAHAAVATVLDTARKRGEDRFATLYATLGPPLAAGWSDSYAQSR
jgi:transposase